MFKIVDNRPKACAKSASDMTFPVLAKARNNGTQVLFFNKDGGVCVARGNASPYIVGELCTSWIDVDDVYHWEIISEGVSVTLTLKD